MRRRRRAAVGDAAGAGRPCIRFLSTPSFSIQAQLALGASSALATLVDVLRRGGGDPATARPVLECLAVALAQAPGPLPGGAPPPGAINAELFSRMDGSLALVLALLAPDRGLAADFGARYYAARLLTAVAVANPGRATAALLATPAGVGRVMDLVADPHDAVRNEALVLALALARASPHVQQVAVLEGGFERLLNIVAAEGGPDGGPVVQDCLDLVAALVAGHAANGAQFREAGHLGRLLPLLRQVDPVKKPSPQQAANLGAVLGVLRALVDGSAAAAALPGQPVGPRGDAGALAAAVWANQDALVAGGAVPTLVSLCLDNGGMPDEGVRVAAMAALAGLIAGCPPGQAALGGSTISVVGRTLPVVQALLRTALRAPTPAERVAGDGVLAALCEANCGGQAELAATITPVARGEGGAGEVSGASGVGAGGVFSRRREPTFLLPLCGAPRARLRRPLRRTRPRPAKHGLRPHRTGYAHVRPPIPLPTPPLFKSDPQLSPPSPHTKGCVPASFGQELVRGLLNEDPTLSVPSARVMAHLLRGCPAVKERLLVQMVEAHPQAGGPERLLLPTLVGRMRAYFQAMGE